MIIEIDLFKVLGRIEPTGSHNEDNNRYENIEKYDELSYFVIKELINSAKYKNSNRASESNIGFKCYEIIKNIKDDIEEELRFIEGE